MLFVRPSVVLVFDRLSDELIAVAPVWPASGVPERLVAAAADRIDAALIDALQRDSSRPIAALADAVALSPSACHRRIRALEEALDAPQRPARGPGRIHGEDPRRGVGLGAVDRAA